MNSPKRPCKILIKANSLMTNLYYNIVCLTNILKE